ncbi:Organic cation transporter 1 [Diplonema papillatum]|nr:Organic cation transporter 1 [Diplonema papillatum]
MGTMTFEDDNPLRAPEQCSSEFEAIRKKAQSYMTDDNDDGWDADGPDDFLDAIGGWGRYQWLNTIISWIAAAVTSCHVMVMYYVHLPQELKCFDAALCGAAPSSEDFCMGINTTDWTNDIYPGWHFVGPRSMQTDWNLECVSRFLIPLSDSAFFIGWLCGGVTCGKLGDMYGRRRPLMLFIVCVAGALCLTTAAPSAEVFVALKFVHGFFVGPLLLTNYVYGTEFVPQKRAAFFGTIYFMISAAGCALLAILAWWLQDWIKFSYYTAAMTAPLVLWPLTFPESPMWLLSVGRKDDAMRVFEKIARVNGVAMPAVSPKGGNAAGNTDVPDAESGSKSAFALLTTKGIRHVTYCMMVVWLSCALCYFGLGLSGATLPGDPYFNAALLSLVELPAYPLQLFAVDSRLGRKKTMIGCLVIGSACCFLTLLPIGDASGWFAFAGNMFMTGGYTATYIWAAEVFPADVRASGLGFCTAAGTMGSSATVFIVDLGKDSLTYSMIAFGSVACCGALASTVIPETRGVPSFQTLSDLLAAQFEVVERVRDSLEHLGDADWYPQSYKSDRTKRPVSAPHAARHSTTSTIDIERSGLPLPRGRPKSAIGFSSSPYERTHNRSSFGHPFLTGTG